MKKPSITLIFGCIGTVFPLFLSSCTIIPPLKPGAENVMVTDGSHLPQCKELGHLSVQDTNGTSIAYTSHEHIQKLQTNELINKTYDLGGNVLVITKHDTTYTADEKIVDTHRMEGDAYLCPEKNLVKAMLPKPSSDVTAIENNS